MTDRQTFTALEKKSLTDIQDAEWDAYYASMTPWLLNVEADIRERTINRLFTAVIWAEPHTLVQPKMSKQERIIWLLNTVDAAQVPHADIIPYCLNQLAYQDSSEPEDPVGFWLQRLSAEPPLGIDPNLIEGTIILRQPFDEDDPADVAKFVSLLDHPSNYVRACAARRMSGAEGDALNSAEMFALIKDKEIVRPGIAGPYWSEWGFMREHVPIDPTIWMMDILEQRSGPEPKDMRFNGIDFYLHEICDHSPEMVLRMMQDGHFNLALETAVELSHVVPGMETVLRQLADHTEKHIRRRAQFHLAHHYRFLHPEAESLGTIRRWPNWSTHAEILSFHYGEDRSLWFVVIYPHRRDDHFNDVLAWSLINQAMPPDLRGDIDFHHLDFARTPPPTPFRLGNQMMWKFTSGANLEMHGDPDRKLWSRIDIGGAHLGLTLPPWLNPC
jgi:hypothetical protein